MRHPVTNHDLDDLAEPLRREVLSCLARWRSSHLGPTDYEALVALVEPGDSVATVAALLGDTTDDDFVLPAEWVTDLGYVLEAYICWSDDGYGVSLLVPKDDAIDPDLLAMCLDLVSPHPG